MAHPEETKLIVLLPLFVTWLAALAWSFSIQDDPPEQYHGRTSTTVYYFD